MIGIRNLNCFAYRTYVNWIKYFTLDVGERRRKIHISCGIQGYGLVTFTFQKSLPKRGREPVACLANVDHIFVLDVVC